MAGHARDHYMPKDTSTLTFSSGGMDLKLRVGAPSQFAVLSGCTEVIPQVPEVASPDNGPSISSEGAAPVLTMRIATNMTAEGLPIVRSGGTIAGDVIMLLQRDQKFKDVTVRLRGALLNPQTNRTFFLDIEHSLVPQWAGLVSTYKAGRHILPFRVTMPFNCNQTYTESLLPPTFSSRGQPMSIRYDLTARIKKPGLWADEQVNMQILYTPKTRPIDNIPLPFLDFGFCRYQLQRHSELLTWAETSKQFSAMIDNERTVIFDSSFALANAPVFARGVFISYMLSLECWDLPALELVANPLSLTVSLVRQVIVDTPGGFSGLGTSTGRPERVTDVVGVGRHWLEPGDQFPKKILRGEVPLRRELRPHFAFPLLSVIYCVVLQLRAEGFSPTNKTDDYLFAMPLGVTTDLPEKVRQSA